MGGTKAIAACPELQPLLPLPRPHDPAQSPSCHCHHDFLIPQAGSGPQGAPWSGAQGEFDTPAVQNTSESVGEQGKAGQAAKQERYRKSMTKPRLLEMW